MARVTCQEGCDLSNGNTFLGDDVLVANKLGFDNTGIGDGALASNINGYEDTPNGFEALSRNIIGIENTATGFRALFKNDGHQNTATGSRALYHNTTAIRNTAVGAHALYGNSTGNNNTSVGIETLWVNKTGSDNTAIGLYALFSNTGSSNTAVGTSAGFNLTTGGNNIDIANMGVAAESNTIRIGNETQTNTFIAGISGATVPTGVAVLIDSTGHLGTTTSSARFKDAIRPMDTESETIFALKPVTFRYKHELDPAGIPQFGLVAEEVEKANPDLVARDEQGKPYSVRYEAVNAMLLNEFLKEHRKNEEQQAIIERQQKQIDAQTVLK